MDINKYVEEKFKELEQGIVATPKDYQYLESFAMANHGSADIILMQLAINYGYKVALENLKWDAENITE